MAIRKERINLDQTVAELQQQMIDLKKALFQDPGKEMAEIGQRQVTEYHTDEEELTRETEWVTKGRKRNKKRKMENSSEICPQQLLQQNIEHNRTRRKQPKLSPIVISQVKNYDLMYKDLKENNFEFTATMLNNDQVKLNVTSADEYRRLTNFLGGSFHWHIYESKLTRLIRIIAKKLHYTCNPLML